MHSPAGTVRDVTRSTDSRDGFARASRSMDGPPHTTPGGRTDGGANGAPEGAWLVQGVVQPSAPPPSVYEAQQRASHELHHRTPHHGSTADVDPDTVRSVRFVVLPARNAVLGVFCIGFTFVVIDMHWCTCCDGSPHVHPCVMEQRMGYATHLRCADNTAL